MQKQVRFIAANAVFYFQTVCCCLTFCLFATSTHVAHAEHTKKPKPPNIVIVMADDMGYGDTQPYNAESKIKTPAFNRLAKEGVLFTDAHSGSAVCTPTRYGLVCGRYAWRTRLKQSVLFGYSEPLIDTDQQTMGSVLRTAGYETACVGKWHLGLGWQGQDDAPKKTNQFGPFGSKHNRVDYSKPVTDGPTHHGFDYSYIIPASLDMSPYVYIENDKVTAVPEAVVKQSPFPKFYRKGEKAPDFKIIGCLDHLTDKATDYISEKAKTDKPFFLYFPMPAPHKPVIPTKKFQGESKLGPYGDFIKQVDAAVGRVIDSIDEAGIAENTLFVYTSDNGSFMHSNENKPDHVQDEKQQRYSPENHRANGALRGTKADVWEAGHRVPFFVRWPKTIDGGKHCKKTICHVDILATVCEITDAKFSRDLKKGAPDSYSFAGSLMDRFEETKRPGVVNHSIGGMFAIRRGEYKLVLGNGSGGRAKPRGENFGKPYQLYNLDKDLSETNDILQDHTEMAAALEEELKSIGGDDIAWPKEDANEGEKKMEKSENKKQPETIK